MGRRPARGAGARRPWARGRGPRPRPGSLSGGQRGRLALAALLVRRSTALLLDDPTNHLSPRLADELEEALGTGPGAVVVATHDRWLRTRWPGRVRRL
nr:ATP-binding cassette domain-containing protein [Streptomyces sp. PT12]